MRQRHRPFPRKSRDCGNVRAGVTRAIAWHSRWKRRRGSSHSSTLTSLSPQQPSRSSQHPRNLLDPVASTSQPTLQYGFRLRSCSVRYNRAIFGPPDRANSYPVNSLQSRWPCFPGRICPGSCEARCAFPCRAVVREACLTHPRYLRRRRQGQRHCGARLRKALGDEATGHANHAF
jgi:hypothetical protein